LVVTTEYGSDDEVKVGFINVQPAPPTADFTVNNSNPMPGEQIQFMDISNPGTSPITSWFWTFGDGTSSNQQNPAHIYTAQGIYTSTSFYTVSLTVQSMVGQDTEIKTNFIAVQP
jgi:PKD repeat protein